MPIYEYKAIGNAHCQLCKDRLCLKESLNLEETFDTHTEEEADELGLEEGFAEDQIWDW